MNKVVIGILCVFLVLYVIPLGVRPMAMPDETRYAEISREMIQFGNWISPTLNGLRYFEKPILGEWLHSVSMLLFGQNAFAIRFPAACATGISALLVWTLVRRHGGGPLPAFLAAALYLTCVEVLIGGTFCILDGVFSLCVTATLVCFYFAWSETETRVRNRYLILSGIGCGLAFLAKGFIAFVLPVIVVGPFLLWQRQWRELFRIWWLPLLAAVVVFLPWAIAIHLKEPDFWRFFFWHEHVQRFLNPESGQHPKVFWYYIPILLVGSLPWCFWFPNVVSGLRQIGFRNPFLQFVVCWFLFPFLFFSACGGKLSSYILPCFPPLMILLGLGILRWREQPGNIQKHMAHTRVSVILITILAFTLVAAQTLRLGQPRLYHAGEEWKWIMGAVAILAYALLLAIGERRPNPDMRLWFNILAVVPVLFCFHFILPDRFREGVMPGEILLQNANRVNPETILVSDDDSAASLCWFFRRNDVYLLAKAGEYEYGLSCTDAEPRLVEIGRIYEFLEKRLPDTSIVLFAKQSFYDRHQTRWPRPAFEIRGCGFVMAEYAPTLATPTEPSVVLP